MANGRNNLAAMLAPFGLDQDFLCAVRGIPFAVRPTNGFGLHVDCYPYRGVGKKQNIARIGGAKWIGNAGRARRKGQA